MAPWIFIALGVICLACMLGAPVFIRWQSRQDRAMHLVYPRIYYICAVVLCESLFAPVLIGTGSLALESDLNRTTLPFPPIVTQMVEIAFICLVVLGFISLAVVGTFGVRATLRRDRERSRGSGG